MEDLVAGYPVVIEVPVAWGEMDAFAHVNNVVYFRYFENARIAYFRQVGIFDLVEETGVGPILASTSCQFRFPLSYPDTVSVATRVPRPPALGEERFVMEYLVVSQRHGKVAARGEGVVVAFDYGAGRKSTLPARLVARIAELEGSGSTA